MSYPSKIMGYALYLEARNGDKTQQLLFTQPVADLEIREMTSATMWARLISETNPRRKWRNTPIKTENISFNASTGHLDKADTFEEALQISDPLLVKIDHHVQNSLKTGWSYVGLPLVVEMTPADVQSLRIFKTPEALIRRVLAARDDDSDYPSELYAPAVAVAPTV